MKLRSIILTAVLLCIAVFRLTANSLTSSEDYHIQGDATEQQQTVDALINQYFVQTMEAAEQMAATQTVESAFNQAMTETQAFQATVNAGFQHAIASTQAAERGLEPIEPANIDRLVAVSRLTDLSPYEIAFSYDQQLFAAAYSDRISIFNVSNPDEPIREIHIEGGVYDMAFGSENKTLALSVLSPRNAFMIFDIETGNMLRALEGYLVSSIVFNPADQAFTTIGFDGVVRQFDSRGTNGALVAILGLEGDEVMHLILDSSRTLIAGRELFLGSNVSIWDLSTGEQILSLPISANENVFVTAIAFSPSGDLFAAADSAGSITLWDTITWTQKDTLYIEPGYPIVGLVFNPMGNLLGISSFPLAENPEVRLLLLDITSGAQTDLFSHLYVPSQIQFSRDGSLFITHSPAYGTLLWGVPSEETLPTLEPTLTAISATNQAIAASESVRVTQVHLELEMTATAVQLAFLAESTNAAATNQALDARATAFACPQSSDAASCEGIPATVNVSSVRLREEPSVTANLVRELTRGEFVLIIGQTPDAGYVFVRLEDGTLGWVAKQTIAMDDPRADIPVVNP
jgi:WD40 repeat protein